MSELKEIDENRKLYLDAHSPEAEKEVDSGNAVVSSGGIRRLNGTMLDSTKRVSFTLKELRDQLSNEKQLMSVDNKIQQLGTKLTLARNEQQGLAQIGWMNNAAIGQLYSLSSMGFQHTMIGLETISNQTETLIQHIKHRDDNALKERINRYIQMIEGDVQKLYIPGYPWMTANIEDHIYEIYAFMKTCYTDLMNGMPNGFELFFIVYSFLSPFADLVRRYSSMFYYETGLYPVNYEKWFGLIKEIASNGHFHNKIQYYIKLQCDIPYIEKVKLGRSNRSMILQVPSYMEFEMDYVLHHTKEQYLQFPQVMAALLVNSDKIPEDGNIVL